jgi:hypothetical protein
MNKNSTIISTALIIGVLSIACFAYYLNLHAAKASPESAEWQLTVTGQVEHPLNLSLSEIVTLPQTTEFATLICVDFPDTIIAQGNWTGVRISYLIEQAGVNATAIKVAFRAKDGYSTDLSMQQAKQDDVILAYRKDGELLDETLRLIVPGHWGYKWISQVSNVELVDYNYLGKWESHGYSDEAIISEGSPGIRQPPIIREFPIASPSNSISPSPAFSPSPTLTASPTPSTPTESPLTTPSIPLPSPSLVSSLPPVPAASQTPTPSPSPILSPAPEPIRSESNILSYLLILGAFTAFVASATVLWKRKLHAY